MDSHETTNPLTINFVSLTSDIDVSAVTIEN